MKNGVGRTDTINITRNETAPYFPPHFFLICLRWLDSMGIAYYFARGKREGNKGETDTTEVQ